MVENSRFLVAAVITFGIIAILIISSPANAFILGFTISNPASFQGEQINFKISGEVEADEILDIQSFMLKFIGPENFSCSFAPDGSLISSCPIIVEKIDLPESSQYGYGYLPGDIEYNVTLDSTLLETGTYVVSLIANLPEEDKLSGTQNLIILGGGDDLGTCSLRAKGGTSIFEDNNFGSKNTLNLFNPKNIAVDGRGLLTMIKGRERVTYEFAVKKAYQLDRYTIIFETTGTSKENRNPAEERTAAIIYNTLSSEISVYGSDIQVTEMKVNFARC